MKPSHSSFSADAGTLPAGGGSKSAVGFTLIEILIAVTLMSVIIFGLMAMFTQTQRAFRLGMNQTDVLEAGRIATDLIVREMEQITPTLKTNSATPGFYVELMHIDNTGVQNLPGGARRTNLMSDLFFTTRENQTLTGIGYFLRTNAQLSGAYGPVGTLYRYQTNNAPFQFNNNPFGMWAGFNQARNNGVLTNVTKVLEGVVHFQARAYDTNGVRIVSLPHWDDNFLNTSTNVSGMSWESTVIPGEFNSWMSSNAVPAYIELEIGILENQTYERYKAIGSPQLKSTYYADHAGNVHLFRQRIPIRRVDMSAYQ